MSYPNGFFKIGKDGWGYHCERCQHDTICVRPPRRNEILRAWCCGTWKELRFTWWQSFRLPTHRLRPVGKTMSVLVGP